MGCLFSIHKKEDYPTESLYIPLLQQKDPPLYRIDSKSTDESLRDNHELIEGTLSFRDDSVSPQPVFESCQEESSAAGAGAVNMAQLQERLERLESNTQENLRLISEDVHLIYQAMIEKENKQNIEHKDTIEEENATESEISSEDEFSD